MGNGNITTGGGGNGSGDGGGLQSVTPLECDVGLGLNTEPYSYPSKKMNFSSPYHHYHQDSEIYGNYYAGNQMASGISSKDGFMGVSGKLIFTANQWLELERQTMIYKYIMASIPIPPQLLLPLSPQSNRVSTGSRFSNGSDPEPWRCRRTDGKKWRCAKDVAPDQKYCERHAHKTRSRSRKPVETQSHNAKGNPAIPSGANQQTRGNDWIIKNGANRAIPVSQLNNQFQQPMHHSSSGGLKRDQFQHINCLDNSTHYLTNTGNHTNGDDCSLSLSMQSGGNSVEFDHESFRMAVGMLNDDRAGCGDAFKPNHQWLNQPSWIGSGLTPGGPLGEALCLGISSTQNEGYSNSTTPSSSSCEGGGDHRLGFIR